MAINWKTNTKSEIPTVSITNTIGLHFVVLNPLRRQQKSVGRGNGYAAEAIYLNNFCK